MKNQKRQKLLMLGLMFGLVSNAIPSAQAGWNPFSGDSAPTDQASAKVAAAPAPAPKAADTSGQFQQDGLTLDQLSHIIKDFEFVRQGPGGREVSISGLIPKRCAENATMSYGVVDKQHAFTIRMPNCGPGFVPKEGEPMVDVANVFDWQKLKDVSGPLVLRSSKGMVSVRDPNRQNVEPIMDGDNAMTFKGSAEIAAEKREKEREQAALAKVAELDKLKVDVTKSCSSGDLDTLSTQLMSSASLLGNVTDLIGKVSDAKKDKLKKALDDADTAEKAKQAYEDFQNQAGDNGWDADELTQAYKDKRWQLAEDASKSTDMDNNAIDKALRSWAKDLKSMDAKEFRKNSDKFRNMYQEVATRAANGSKWDDAVKFYDKAKTYADQSHKNQIDGQIAKLYVEQFKDCVKTKGVPNMKACEDATLSKAKAAANRISQAIASEGGDSQASDLASWNSEYAGVFGGGQTYNFSDIGAINQIPGLIGQYKVQMIQQYVQQQQQAQQAALRQAMTGGAAGVTGLGGIGAAGATGLGGLATTPAAATGSSVPNLLQ